MQLLIVFPALILVVSSLDGNYQWASFKVKHGKSYQNPIEENLRYSIFRSNLKKIEEHNARYEAGEETYTMGVNKFADLTEEEFKEIFRLQRENKPQIRAERLVFPEGVTVPDSIDWRDEGAVLPVRDQGFCVAGWAFSATGALEGQNYILNKKSEVLSVQSLLDCSQAYGNMDCDYGGYMTSAFEYVEDHGMELESDYPYEGDVYECRTFVNLNVLRIKGHFQVDTTEEDLKTAVGSIGPMSVTIYAEPIQLYEKGIFNSTKCVSDQDYLDHGLLAVGYGVDGNQPYWILKNSWGTSWGESGYIRLARNADQCGIAIMASYPVL